MKKILSLVLASLMIMMSLGGLAVSAETVSNDIIYAEEDYTGAIYTTNTPYGVAAMEAFNQNLKYNPIGTVTADAAPYEVRETEQGKRYVVIKDNGGGPHSSVAALPGAIETGNVVWEMKLLPLEGAQEFRFIGGVWNGSSERWFLATSNEGKQIMSSDQGADAFNRHPNRITHSFEVGEDGFYSLKIVLNRKSAADAWTISLYDKNDNDALKDSSTLVWAPGAFTADTYFFFGMTNGWGAMPVGDAAIGITDLKLWSPKAVTFTENAAYDNDTKTVSFNVSEALDANTVSAQTVKVADVNGNNVTVENVSYENNVLTVTTGEIAGSGTCTLSFDGVKTARKTAVYETASFEVEGVAKLLLYSVVNEGKSVVLTFSNTIDDNSLSGVTLTKANGSAIPGGYNVTADGSNVIITFGSVPTDDYLLTIPATLKDKDGVFAEAEVKTVKISTEKILLDADFENLSESSTAAEIASATNITPVTEFGDNVWASIKTVDGNNVFNVRSLAAYRGVHGTAAFETVDKGVLELNVKVNRNGDDFLDYSALHLSSINGDKSPYFYQGGNWATPKGDWKNPAVNEGWESFKFVYSRKTTAENWLYAIYDASNSTLLESGELDYANSISSFNMGRMYTMSANEHNVYIDDLLIKAYDLTSAIKTEYEDAANEAYIYFDNDVNAQSINKNEITLSKDAVIENAVSEVSYDAATRKMTVKFAVNPGTADYTLGFGNITDVNGNKLLDTTLATDAKVLTLLSLEENAKSKVLVFSGNVDPDTLGAITITTENDDAIKGLCTVSANGTVVTIKHGVLEAGNYKINISADLKDESGNQAIAESKPFAVADLEKVFVNTGFDALSEDSPTDMFVGVTKLTPVIDAGLTGGVKTVNGNNVFTVNAGSLYKGAHVSARFDEVKTGVLEVSMKANRNGYDFADWSAMHLFIPNEVGSLLCYQGGHWVTHGGNWVNPVENEGWANIKFLLSRETTSEGWTYKIYDISGENPVLLESGIYNSGSLEGISNAMIGRTYTMSANAYSYSIDDVVVKAYPSTKAVKTEYDAAANKAYIYYDNDIDATTVKAENVLTSTEGVIPAIVSQAYYSVDDRKITVEFAKPLDTAEYVINFKAVTDVNGNLLDSVSFAGVASGVIFENVKFMSGEDEVKTLPLEATEIAISADVKNVANAEGNYEVILAVYNDGRLETILSTGAQKTTADGSSKPVYVNATGLSLTENHEIKAFFFEDLSNLSSLRVPEVLSPVQFQ